MDSALRTEKLLHIADAKNHIDHCDGIYYSTRSDFRDD